MATATIEVDLDPRAGHDDEGGCGCCGDAVGASYRLAARALFEASPGYRLLRDVAGAPMPEAYRDWRGPPDAERTELGAALERGYVEFRREEARARGGPFALAALPALRALGGLLGISAEDMSGHMSALAAVMAHRREYASAAGGLSEPSELSAANAGVWGSDRQYRFGLALRGTLREAGMREAALAPGGRLHPSLAPFLAPCGGIVGAENDSLYLGTGDSAIVLHAAVHDASGYALLQHGVGPGYNYLRTSLTWRETSSPLSCQVMGILAAKCAVRQLARERGD